MRQNKKYCVRMNNFKSNVKATWQELQIAKDFTDVTLACDDDDDMQIRAHKIILSFWSPVFKSILKLNNQHPSIYITGTKNNDLQNLMSLMYQGEVNVIEEDLDNFLQVVDDLKIRGISASKVNFKNIELLAKRNCSEEGPTDEKNIQKSRKTEEDIGFEDKIVIGEEGLKNFPEINKDEYNIQNSRTDEEENSFQEKLMTGDEDLKYFSGGKENLKMIGLAELNESSLMQNLTSPIKNFEEKSAGVKEADIEEYKPDIIDNNYQMELQNEMQPIKSISKGFNYECEQCDYKTLSKGNLKKHVQGIHECLLYPCDQCNYQATEKSHLKRHIKAIHEGVRYQCEYKATDKGHLKKHIQAIHDKILYPCGQCEYKSGFKAKLKTHVFNKHMKTRY